MASIRRAADPDPEPVWTVGATAALALTLLLGVVAPLFVAARHRSPAPDRIAIIVGGLPPGEAARILVSRTGLAPHPVTITRRGIAEVPEPGTYRLVAAPVKVLGGTYFAMQPAQSVVAHSGRPAQAIVNYADFISASTRVLTVPAGDTVLLADPPHITSEELILGRSDAPRGLRPDDYLTSGPAPGEPGGYLVRVQAEEPAPADEIALDVSPATPPEILEKAEVNGSSATLELSADRPITDRISCGGSAGLTLVLDVRDFERSFSFHLEWNHQGRPGRLRLIKRFRSAAFQMHLGEHLAGTVTSSGDASCDLVKLKRSLVRWRLPLVSVPIPGAHLLTVRPIVDIVLTGNLKVSHDLKVRFDQQAGATLRITCARGKSCTTAGSEFTSHSLKFNPEGEGPELTISGELEIIPTLRLHLWGLAGPHAGLGAQLKLEASPASKQLSLKTCAIASAGAEIRPFAISYEARAALSLCRPPLHLSLGRPPPNPAQTASGAA